jgi:LysR family glycine cleavage system transcriptional activator
MVAVMNARPSRRRIPSLMALRAFDAASRSGTFTKAAEELLLTQSAVSRHMRNLEEELGVTLFHRRGRDVALTPDGLRLKAVVVEAFDRLTAGIDELRSPRPGPTLTVSLLPSLAARWLAPRISEFAIVCPDVELKIHCTRAVMDLEREGIDVAIRYGRGHWPRCSSELLMREEIVPVCAPGLYARLGRALTPEALSDLPLLHGDLPDGWREWLRAAGRPGADVPRGPLFSDDNALLQAAIEGHGIALGRSVLVARDLAEGRLVQPFDIRIPATFSYWIVTRENRPERPEVAAFRAFLASEARKSFERHA